MARYPKSNFSIAFILTVIIGIAVSALPTKKDDTTERVSLSISPDTPINLSLAKPDLDSAGQITNTKIDTSLTTEAAISAPTESASTYNTKNTHWQIETVRKGDSLSGIFKRAGLSPAELQAIMSIGKHVKVLAKIKPGQSLHFQVNEAGTLDVLKYMETPLKTLNIIRDGDSYSASWAHKQPQIVTSYKSANITANASSLFLAGKEADLSDNLIMNLANIFQWDVSFALDMRVGDKFTLLFQDIYIDGVKVKEGDILAAQFTNMGKTYTAVLYEDKNGFKNYFTPKGKSLRKAFLRDPVHFSRVSSRFNMKRLHPIQKVIKPHRGIDYAAARGTPVVASGDGKVKIARRNNASGKYVVIQHGQQYTTKYLHLSAFAKGVRSGKTVKQGQVIGYVGATGLASGPHLHYEFLVNGVHRNPRTVTLPNASPILNHKYDAFKDATESLLLQLSSVSQDTAYALASDD